MCGNVGCVGDLDGQSKRMFKALLELDVIRGDDSTGVMIHNRVGSEIFKEVGVPWTGLYRDADFQKAMSEPLNNIFLGHNRAATTGVVNKVNAHPFESEHIIGSHNGTLLNTYQLDDHLMFDVDSENIFHHLAGNGVEDTISKLNGAYALVWYNAIQDTMNFIRNSQRPLFFAYNFSEDVLFWASDEWMLRAASKKARITLSEVHAFREMCHYKIDVPAITGSLLARKFGKMRVRKMIPYKYSYSYHGGNYRRGSSGHPNNIFQMKDHKPKALPAPKDRAVRGQKILFVVDEANKKSTQGSPYLRGHMLGEPSQEIRIFAIKDSDAWKQLAGALQRTYEGTIKKLKKGYFLINVGSIKDFMNDDSLDADLPFELDDGHGEETIYRVGEERGLVTLKEFIRLLEPGCCICGDPLTVRDEPELDWWGDSPICGGCDAHDAVPC